MLAGWHVVLKRCSRVCCERLWVPLFPEVLKVEEKSRVDIPNAPHDDEVRCQNMSESCIGYGITIPNAWCHSKLEKHPKSVTEGLRCACDRPWATSRLLTGFFRLKRTGSAHLKG